ncbi:uncharacterized protein LKV04_021911 [Tautogolabrus adspersus]
MERYESLGLVGEGSYGTVLKCRHRESGRLVAIKKFMDSDDDKTVKKIALREIKLLRQLRHDNLVNLLEVWKRRRRWYLVFEFVERTLLDDLEKNPNGLDLNTSRQYLYQILRAVAFCHQQNIIHRDIKPENILISQGDLVKLCDFGFARTMTTPTDGGIYTDYVATRWYRAPELLVGDTKYGKPVDVWAVGCLLLEMLTGQPLFPGDSDLDQIFHIVRCFGNLTAHHQELFYRNPVFSGVRLPQCSGRVPLEQRFPSIATNALDIAQNCLQIDPESRAHCSELLEHPLFTQNSFNIRFLEELNAKIQKDHRENSTLPIIAKTQRREKDDVHGKNQRRKDKKQSEDSEEKFNMEKEKRDKGDREDKLPKTKAKQPSKPKNIHNTSEPLMSTKQSKTSGAKTTDNAARITKVDHGQTAIRTTKPSKTTSKSGPKIAKENTSLSNSPSDGFTSDLSAQSSTVFIGGSLAHGTTLPKANLQIGSSLDTKPSNDTQCLPDKPSTELQTNKDLGEVLIATTSATTTQQYSCYTSKEDIKEPNGCFTRSSVTKTAEKHSETLDVLSGDYKENPEYDEACSINQQGSAKSKITKESRTTSTFSSNEIPKTKTPLATIVPKTFKVSDTENSEELTLSAPNSPSTKSFIDQIPKVARSPNLEQTEPNVKSLRPLHPESLIGGPKSKIGSLSNPTKSPATMAPKAQINTLPTDAKNKRGILERNDPMNTSTTSDSTSFTSTATPDEDASTRIFHNMYTIDVNKFNFSVFHSSPPPPPPPPSSTPLLLPPSSTPLIPSISIVSATNPAASDHFTLGPGYHSGTNNLRCTDKPRHQSGIYSRLTQQSLSSHITGSLTYQIPEKGQIYEHSFRSDHCNLGNSGGGNTLTKKKSDIHFPDLRSSVPPEHKGREGKQPNKGTSKDQRKDQQAISPSDQQKLVNNVCLQTPQ